MLLAARVYGSWLFDISIKTSTFKHTAGVANISSSLSFLILVHVKGQDGNKQGGYLCDFKLAFSVFIQEVASSKGSINCTSNLCRHDSSAYEGPHSGVENTVSTKRVRA